jgi:hypothetical protein
MNYVDCGTAYDGGVLYEHGAEEAGDGRGKKRDESKSKHGGAKLRVTAQVTAVLKEDCGGHGDGDGREPGDMLLPLHSDGVPGAGGGAGEKQALWKCG